MGFFSKSDDRFVEKAVEDNRRASAIAEMSTARVVLFIFAIFFAVSPVFGLGPDYGVGGAVFVAFYWSIVLKMESELRFLKVIDRLRKEGRFPPV
jgi:hypothetical protein